MLEIGNISDDAFQTQTVVTDDGISFYMELYFVPLQLSWIITKLTYEDFTLENIRVCNSPNLLHQFKNQLPFGIAVKSDQDREPMFLEDFQEGYSKMYLLTEDEMEEYSEYLSGV